ncbi:hypothetical protein E3P81_01833, partial [Wallemia ichthyophaga]
EHVIAEYGEDLPYSKEPHCVYIVQQLEKNQEDASEEVTWPAITGDNKANKERAQTEREQIDDLSMELELADEDQPVLYKLGDSFVYISLEKAQSQIEADCNALDAIIDGLKSRAEDCERSMSELKVHLKSKFKDSINLDR